ncbi:MAG TPA: phosphatase PAP2 family protein [Nocardioidaceae bacterium]|nr:phosphatase PAP2 family protein [Nocardioidaceae bacterium]
METTSRTPRVSLLRAITLELLLVGLLIVAYRYGRMIISHSSATAFHNADEMVGWEQTLHLPNEIAVQHLLLSSQWLARFSNIYYFSVHFPLTAGILIWMFIRSRAQYARIRTSMAMLTGFALLIHAAFPLAPARMLHGLGFVDTAAMYGPNVYASSPQHDSVANQFAAMPSLHFGWAVLVAVGIIRVSRSPLRWLWIAHPVITLLVIVGTGNHYWLDAAVAGGLIILSERVIRAWSTAGRTVPIERPAFGIGLPSVSTYEPLVGPAVASAIAPAACERCLPSRRGPPAHAGPPASAAEVA